MSLWGPHASGSAGGVRRKAPEHPFECESRKSGRPSSEAGGQGRPPRRSLFRGFVPPADETPSADGLPGPPDSSAHPAREHRHSRVQGESGQRPGPPVTWFQGRMKRTTTTLEHEQPPGPGAVAPARTKCSRWALARSLSHAVRRTGCCPHTRADVWRGFLMGGGLSHRPSMLIILKNKVKRSAFCKLHPTCRRLSGKVCPHCEGNRDPERPPHPRK